MTLVEAHPRTLPRHSGTGRTGRNGSKVRRRIREQIISPLGLLCVLFLAGCATATITPTVRAPAGLPRPDRVLVHDFEVAPADGELNGDLVPPMVRGTSARARTEEEMRSGKAAAKVLTDSLVAGVTQPRHRRAARERSGAT